MNYPFLDFEFCGRTLVCGERPLVMGILNVTPDSFSDGGLAFACDQAIARGQAMVAAGADILDIGGESTRPGAAPVGAEEEQRRIVPVIQALHRELGIPISVDTYKASTARAAAAAGAGIINDISGGHRDPEMLRVAAETGAGLVLMHMRGTPDTMRELTHYDDLVGEIREYFQKCRRQCERLGIPERRIVFDPGIGFAKTAAQSLKLIAATAQFRELGRPILQAPSRKSFIGTVLGQPDPKDRTWGTAAAVAASFLNGADLIRVHDVAEMTQVAKVAWAIRTA